jgi:hypothetical protein
MITLTTDFECGNGKAIEQLAPDQFKFQVRADLGTGYGSYFCFDLINDGPAAEVTVEVWEDARFGKPTSFGKAFPTTIWFKSIDDHRYRPLRDQLPECRDNHITLKVPVEEAQHVRVGITYVAPYSEVVSDLTRIAEERSDLCTTFSLGSSVEGRDLIGLKAGTEGKPKIFCVAGQHTSTRPPGARWESQTSSLRGSRKRKHCGKHLRCSSCRSSTRTETSLAPPSMPKAWTCIVPSLTTRKPKIRHLMNVDCFGTGSVSLAPRFG